MLPYLYVGKCQLKIKEEHPKIHFPIFLHKLGKFNKARLEKSSCSFGFLTSILQEIKWHTMHVHLI